MTVDDVQRGLSSANLKRFIRSKGMSYTEFARYAGIEFGQLRMILNGEILIPRFMACQLSADYPDAGTYEYWRGMTDDSIKPQNDGVYLRKTVYIRTLMELMERLMDMAVKHESEADCLCRDYEFGIADGLMQAVSEIRQMEV